MLFDFYYGEAEKMSPTVYEGLPIYSESDLISLIREKCDDDLAEAVQRYVYSIKCILIVFLIGTQLYLNNGKNILFKAENFNYL